MLRLSWAGFRERWTLFAGAVLTVCLGVALVQSSLLLLVSASTTSAPAGAGALARMSFDASTEAAVALLGVTLGFAALLAVFIISSTFAFTVEQRRRELALLRLVGGARRQIRRLLLAEATLLGLVGSALGVPVGVALMGVQTWLLHRLGFVPDGFSGQWRLWIVAVSVGTGVVLAVVGVSLAARRAARVRPLDALRDTGEATRVMTTARLLTGLLFLAGAVTLIGLSPVGGAVGGQAMAMNVSVCAAIALTLLGPSLVPAVARLIPARAAGVLGGLATANLRDDRRRTASTAAPVIVLVGLVLGQASASSSFTAAGQLEQQRRISADLVIDAPGPTGDRVTTTPGVASASTEVEVPIALTTGSGDLAYTRSATALLVDPAGYGRTHPGAGDLTALRQGAVVAGPGADGFSPGDTVGVRVGDQDLGSLPVVAAVPQAIGGGATVLLPAGVVPAEQLADVPSHTFVQLLPDVSRQQAVSTLTEVGTVSDLDSWLERDSVARTATSTGVLIMVMGLGGLYALIGVINSVVVAGATRPREFAAVRVTGFTRGQVVRAAVLESIMVAFAGLLLGLLAAAGTLIGVIATTAAVAGTVTVDVPWLLVGAVVVGTVLVTAVTSALTTRAATRQPPVALLGARQ
ncbi:ABC transporter permease [Actinoplanes cyaneus]|uniref:ABC transporter permease n=2 Tax=Actinoplanes cyaneus TaxID=52696 RepID=A0A919ISU0_9ACTN|nr:ABC transporter permease [Actinoplanes cyaneus]MCW2144097.1 putative ABC transport system permease protein [Actinoplanes cyaneus]GID70788.1 ABC transporter permease [Actinoplanes cyaneus]